MLDPVLEKQLKRCLQYLFLWLHFKIGVKTKETFIVLQVSVLKKLFCIFAGHGGQGA
jgi:hypothetical protein